MTALIQPAVETPVLVRGNTDEEKRFPGSEPCSSVASFGPISNISTPTTIALNGFQPIV